MNADFRIGDRIICIAAGHLDDQPGDLPALRLNAEYIVHNIKYCPSCNRMKLDVGLALISNAPVRCLCGHRTQPINNTHWCESIRFVKKESKSDLKTIEKQLTKALLDEDYDKAAILRDKILELKSEK